MRKAAIILPTYNESKNIIKLIDDIGIVAKGIHNWEIHIVVVDSDSPDKTGALVEDLYNSNKKDYRHLHIIHTKKEGLGKAYLEGFKTTMETIKPYVLFEMDADFSHSPDKIPEFLAAIEQGADIVVGSRYIPGGSIPQDWGIDRKIFSVLGNWIIRLGFMKMSITDWTNGFRAIRTWVVEKSLPHIQGYSGYVFQIALLDSAIKSGAQVKEIPIKFIDRTEGVSKINSGQYISHILLYIINHSSFVKFCIVGGMGFIIDFGISFILIELTHAAVWLATLLSTETAIISNYLMNNFWSFAHKKVDEGNRFWSFLKFNVISSGSIAIQTLGVQLAANMFGRQYWFIYKIVIIALVIIPYSYFFYTKFVWKDK